MQKKQRYIFDLFAGCGGLSLGLENAGFLPVLVSELDDHARDTYVKNRSHKLGNYNFKELKSLHFSDVTNLCATSVKKSKNIISEICEIEKNFDVDLIVGGPPCQGYSGIGHRRSYSVDKKELPSNKLYEPMANLIELVKPKAFLFENVRGILSGRWTKEGEKGEIWNDVRKRFASIEGYITDWQLVQAKNYGVPQNRPRVLLVGIRKDVAKKAQLKINNGDNSAIAQGLLPPYGSCPAPDLIDLLSDLIDPETSKILDSQNFPQKFTTLIYKSDPKTSLQKQLRTRPDGSVMSSGDVLTEQEYSKHKSHIVEKFKFMLANNGAIADQFKTKKFAQRVLPSKWGNKGPYITATSLPDDYVHFQQPRILTVREWARLQTFPDWYEFSGKRTTGGTRRAGVPTKGNFERELPKYTQIGNAVPVKLAEAVGQHLINILENAGE